MSCKNCQTYGKNACAPITVNMVGGVFRFDETGCPTFTSNVDDGTIYGIEVVDGKISGYIMEPPALNPPIAPCAPAPGNCGTGTGTGGGSVDLNPSPLNLTTMTALGLLTQLHCRGENVTITGAGTLADPLTIAVPTSAGGGTIYGAGAGIDISPGSPALISVNVDTLPGASGTVGSLTIKNGLVTSITEEQEGEANLVVGGSGIKVDNVGGRYMVAIEDVVGMTTRVITNGRQQLTVGVDGRIHDVAKDDDLPVSSREVPYAGGIMVFTPDGVLRGLKPTTTRTKQIIELKRTGATASGRVTVTLPAAGDILITVDPFGINDVVSVQMMQSDSLDFDTVQLAARGTGTYRATNAKVDLIYSIAAPTTSGEETPAPRGQRANIIVEYLGA